MVSKKKLVPKTVQYITKLGSITPKNNAKPIRSPSKRKAHKSGLSFIISFFNKNFVINNPIKKQINRMNIIVCSTLKISPRKIVKSLINNSRPIINFAKLSATSLGAPIAVIQEENLLSLEPFHSF